MGLFKIEWKNSAKKELKNLPVQVIAKILSAVESLPKSLYPAGSRKIIGLEHAFRLRIGNYRIVYSVDAERLIVEIVRVGHRKDVYKNISRS